MKPALVFLIVLLAGSAGFAKDFPVTDFGATGDGKTDDGAAIQKAVDAAVAAGPGSRVVFEPKTYRLDWRKTAPYQISLAGAKDIAIEGNGAVLVSHPRNNLISLKDCSGVSVKGFTVDCDPLPFTQGTITEVNAKEGWIDLRIHKVVRNCTFREQRRHAILARAPGGIIEGNTIDGVGGSGVYMTNEFGSFCEGPVPQDCIIRNNVFRNTQGVPIVVGSKRASSPAAYAKKIRITGNSIEGLSAPCIQAFSVSGLAISGNKWSLRAAAPAGTAPLSLTNNLNEAVSGNTGP